MPHDPWTDSDPEPGDFDAELTEIDPRYVEAHVGNPDAKLKAFSALVAPARSRSARPRF